MKQFYKYILTLVVILLTTANAWAGKAKINANSDPSEGGFVYVANSAGSYTPIKNSDDATQDGDFWTKKDKTFYLYYKESANYHFKGWYQVSKGKGCDANSTNLTNQGQSVTHKADGGLTTADYYYYAIFATVQCSQRPSFATIAMGNSTTGTLSIKHAHANSITIEITGENASDFKINNTTSYSFNSTALGTQNITITFKPTCAGDRKANLKITNGNGLPELNIAIQASATLLPQTIAWDNAYSQDMFVGGTLNVSATASTGHTVTYESSNPNVISITGNTLTAKAIGEAIITATQHDGCTYQTVSTSLIFTVNDKKTPTFWLNGDPNQLTDNLKTEDTRTITITNVDERMTADYDPNLLSYTFNGSTATIKALDADTATLKLTQPENNQIFYGERTFTFYITKYDTNTITNDLATNYMVDDVVDEADIYTINNHEVPVQIISGNNNVLKFENGQLKAVGAGTTTLTVKQSATNKWVERTATKTITVHKYDITASINPDNAVWNQLVTPNPFSASTQHKFYGATSTVTDFTVTQQGNEHIALMDVNTRNIQTYYTNGQVNFLITRPEDYKYNALNQILTLHVKQSTVNCPVLEDNDERYWSTINNSRTYTIPSGTPDSLFFQAKRTEIFGVSNTSNFYAEYSTDNSNWTKAMTINLSSTNTWYNLKCDIPATAKYVRFSTEFGATGNKHIQNVRVTRKKDLTPSDSIVTLPVTSIGTPENKTFTLKWSTCADEILLTNSNPHFTLNTYRIQPTNNEGSAPIKVTCDASVVGSPLRDTIVIYDNTQRIFVPVVCEVNDKFIANIKGTTAYSKKVDDTWVADFKFDTCQTTLPSDDINAPFYYTIKDDLTGNDVQNPEYKDQVISYNPQNYTITAHNAGTAVITFIQKPTISHYTDTFRCVITVSKYDAELQWKDPVYYNDTISNYFTTTDTISPILIVSQTDTDVAKLTKTTSNNSLDLITFNKEDSTIVTVSQEENYKWNGYSKKHTIRPIDPNNHVTFTLTQNNYPTFKKNSYIERGWDEGVKLGDGGGGFNWDDKFTIIGFTGIPDSLTFTFKPKDEVLGDISGIEWYVQESPTNEGTQNNNGQNPFWTAKSKKWTSTQSSGSAAIKLDPETRFLKLCYSGNYAGAFINVTVTELNEFRAVDSQKNTLDKDTLDFGANQVYTTKTRTFDLRYANPGYKITVESTDPHFTVTPDSIGNIGGEHHGTLPITVSYTSTEKYAVSGDAMIIIKDEIGHADTVRLYASSDKAQQVLHWCDDFEAILKPIIRIKNGNITDAAWATSKLPVTLTSSDENVIKISADSTTLIPVAVGEAEITAYQKGNEMWLPATPITKTFIVTDKLLQYIIWDDDFTNIIKEDIDLQTLPLTAKVYLQQENDTAVFSQEQTDSLVYKSANDSIVSASGTTLTVHNIGKTTLTVSVDGNDDYAPASLTKPVIVRSPALGCEDDLLYHHEGDPIQFFQMNLDEVISKTLELDLTKGIPGYVNVAHEGKSWDLVIQYYAAEIRVEQSLDNGTSWNTAGTIKPERDKENLDSIPLSRQATHIRFVRNAGGQGYQFLNTIDVHPAQYIEARDINSPHEKRTVVPFGEIHVGSSETRTFLLDYSNIKHSLSPVPSTPEVTATPSSFSDCNGFGRQEISVTWLPTEVNDNATATVTFTDPNSGMEKVVTLTAKIIKGKQFVVWDDQPATIEDCGTITFPKYTTAHLPITWTVTQGKEYADFNEQGMLEIYKNGTIIVQATQEGTANYEPLTPVSFTFDIQLNITFVGTEDTDWNNPNNWAMCRLPLTEEVVTIAAPAELSTHDTIKGVIFDSNTPGSIHITHTGGLTINEAGVTNAATDGSSITIDNNPQGAGFLLISPSAPEDNKHPYFTMDFTTRAFNEGVPRDETWQYMGAPGNNATFKDLNSQTLIYHWDETKGWTPYTVTDTIPTWQGYALTQSIQANHTYQITAQAIQGTKTIDLTYTASGMKGDNLFVNSFTAPIDITKIDTTDISVNWGYKTFYFFNTGSWNDWQGTNPNHSHDDASSAGHYYAVPLFSAPYLEGSQTIVPPMQGVYVHTEEAPVSITLNYEKHVWNGTAGNLPMRAPQKQDPNFRRIRIQASSENSGADRMYIIQESSTTRGYDNGYDGKNINASGQVNIYTNEPFGKMEVSCANDIDSMYIGFRAGSDSEYRLTFSSLIGGSIYIKDLEDNSITRMNEGGEYHFQATPNSVNHSRFQILLHPSEITDENTAVEDNHVSKINIWIDNKYLHITDAPANSPATIYAISGQRITSYIVNTSHYTIPLSSLSNGIYILQIGDQRYKFVCK